jgi:UDP-glucose 4-epimerase
VVDTSYENKVVLITGGAGAIGRNLSERLALAGAANVVILDNLSAAYIWNIPNYPNITFIKGDIRNEEDVLKAFRYQPRVVFHLAAFFANQNSVDYPFTCADVNINGLIKLLEYSVLSNSVERFVFANSEGGVYGADCPLPYQENKISLDLGSPYYISKLCGEAFCRYYFDQYGLPITVLRLFNSFGPGEVPGQYRNVIPNFIYWALQKKPLPLTGTDKIARDFVYVNDTVEGLLRGGCYKEAIGESINIATGRPVNIYDLAEIINQKTKNPSGMYVGESRKWDKRPIIIGDPSKAAGLLDFEAKTRFEQGIDHTINWFQKNWPVVVESAEFPPGRSAALPLKKLNTLPTSE